MQKRLIVNELRVCSNQGVQQVPPPFIENGNGMWGLTREMVVACSMATDKALLFISPIQPEREP